MESPAHVIVIGMLGCSSCSGTNETMSIFGTEEWLYDIHSQILNHPPAFFFFLGYNQIFIIPVGATSIQIKEVKPSRNFLGMIDVGICVSVHLDSSHYAQIWFSGMGFGMFTLRAWYGRVKSWISGSEFWVSLKCEWCTTLGFTFPSFSLLWRSCCWVGNKNTQTTLRLPACNLQGI